MSNNPNKQILFEIILSFVVFLFKIINMYRVLVDAVQRTPKNIGSISIDPEKKEENGALFFRNKLSDTLVFTGADYEYIAAITDLCQEIEITIEQRCSSGWQVIYDGFSTITKCSFVPDQCRVEVEVMPNDEYTCILDNIDKEVNFLAETTIVDLQVSDLQAFEYLVSINASETNWDLVDTYVHSGVGESFYVHARKRVATACVGGIPQAPPDDGSGEAWTLLTNNCATSGFAIYWRGMSPTEESLVQLALFYEECTLPSCPSPNPPPANSVYIGDATGAFEGVTVYILNNVVTDVDLPNGRYLIDVLDYILSEIGCALTVSSDFFTNATNPVTGNPSTTKDLVLFEKSDIVRPDASEKASKSLITLGQLLNDLSILFNVRWYVDSVTSELVIEHISDLIQTPDLDLTTLDGGKWIKNKNSYEYINAEIPVEEKFKFPVEAVSADFAGLPIEYALTCATITETIYQTNRIETEFNAIYKNEEAGLDGVVLISPETLNTSGANSSLAENGRLSGVFAPNAPLGYAALLPDYHTWDRPLDEGAINNVTTVFDSTKPLKKQMELKVPYCCYADFDPIRKVTTGLGDGDVLEVSYDLKTKSLTLSLGFEL